MLNICSGSDDTSEVHLGRMLQILREFSTDPILIIYVIDDVWEYMKAMKVQVVQLLLLLIQVKGFIFTCFIWMNDRDRSFHIALVVCKIISPHWCCK